MSYWMDLAGIVFACTAANHLGLIEAVEQKIGRELPVVNCCKCLTFWSVLAYCSACCDNIATVITTLPRLLATSFLCAYIAVWTELAMGIIDRLYNRIYDKTYSSAEDQPATPAPDGNSTENGVS